MAAGRPVRVLADASRGGAIDKYPGFRFVFGFGAGFLRFLVRLQNRALNTCIAAYGTRVSHIEALTTNAERLTAFGWETTPIWPSLRRSPGPAAQK